MPTVYNTTYKIDTTKNLGGGPERKDKNADRNSHF
jgi:hypothetical protein